MKTYKCPKCNKTSLESKRRKLFCSECQSYFPKKKGVPLLFSDNDWYYFKFLNQKQTVFNQKKSKKYFLKEKDEYINTLQGLNNFPKVKEILDLGAGYGGFVRMLQKNGYVAYALEINLKRAQKIRKRGITTICGETTNLPFFDSSFDAVTLISVLPHLAKPSQSLKEIRRVLKKNGILVIDSINPINILFRVRYLFGRWDRIADKQGWHYFHSTFSGKKLIRKVERLGFKLKKDLSYFPFPSTKNFVHLPWPSLTCYRYSLFFRLKE